MGVQPNVKNVTLFLSVFEGFPYSRIAEVKGIKQFAKSNYFSSLPLVTGVYAFKIVLGTITHTMT